MVVLVAVLSLMGPGRALAMNYYLSSAGDDSKDGTTVGRAWRSIERANRGRFAPGDCLLFHAGETFQGNLALSPSNAEPGTDGITVTSFGRGQATILAGDGTGVLVRNLGNVTVSDIIVVGSGRATNRGSGVEFRNDLDGDRKLERVRIDNVQARGFGLHGIVVHGDPADRSQSGYRDVRITNCIGSDNVHTGILVRGVFDPAAKGYANENVYIGHCKAFDNSGIQGYHNHSGNGIFLEDVDGGVIERCVAYNNGFLCDFPGGGPIGIWTAVANNVTIQLCESHHNRTMDASADGGGFDFDGGVTNSTMQYNYSHDNDGSGYLVWMYEGSPHVFRGNTVRYNISENDCRKHGYGAIHCGGDISDCDIYNNTVYISPTANGTPKGIVAAGVDMRFCNNLIVTTGGLPLIEGEDRPGLIVAGNCYWSSGDPFLVTWGGDSYDDLNAWRAATGQERAAGKDTGVTADPLLGDPGHGGTFDNADKLDSLAAYRPRPGSPLIGAGLNLRALFGIDLGERDYNGSRLSPGGRYSVGACEGRR
ncbi:MAG: right-handed parallel beta-helix repeat-containing protein [Armatimonadota bacterium]